MSGALVKRWFCGFCLIGWAVVLLHFHASGRLEYYLAPSFHWIVLAGGILAVILAFAYVVLGRSWICADPDCSGCAAHIEDTRFRSWLPLLAVVLLVGGAIAVTEDRFSIQTILNTGFIENASSVPGLRPSFIQEKGDSALDDSIFGEPAFDPKAYLRKTPDGAIIVEIVDLMFASEDAFLRADFVNEPVEVIGQFVPMPDASPQDPRYRLSRLFMWCCAADSRPLAITVATKDIPDFEPMSWVKIRGVARFPVENGKHTVVIEQHSIESSPPPEEEFLF